MKKDFHFSEIAEQCEVLTVNGEDIVVYKTGENEYLRIENIENMTEENLADFFGRFTELYDAFYEPAVGKYRFELKPHVEPQDHTEGMFDGVDQYVPGDLYDIYLYKVA